MFRQLPISIIVLMCVLLAACQGEGSKTSWAKEGYEGKNYKKLAVVCVNESKKVRKKFRKRIVRALKAKGIQAASGKDIFPDGLTEADKDPEHLISRLNSEEVDGVLAAFIIREKTKAPEPVELKGEGVYWVGKFVYRRFVIDQEDDLEPDDDEEELIQESFVVETVLHDVSPDLTEKRETLVWRGKARIEKDSTTKAAAQYFADSLAIQLVNIDSVVIQQ